MYKVEDLGSTSWKMTILNIRSLALLATNIPKGFLNVLYHLNQEYLVWPESKTAFGDFIRKGKENVFGIFLQNTGMALDVVQQSNSHGGTSTDGNSG